MTTHPDAARRRAWAHFGGWGLGPPMSLAGLVMMGLELKLVLSLRHVSGCWPDAMAPRIAAQNVVAVPFASGQAPGQR